MVSLTFFSYAVGDVDPYDEVSVAVVVRQPGAHHFNTTELLSSMRNHKYCTRITSKYRNCSCSWCVWLPIPKWLTPIDMKIGDKSVQAHIYNTDGKPDLSVAAPLPEIKTVKPQSRIDTKPCINW